MQFDKYLQEITAILEARGLESFKSLAQIVAAVFDLLALKIKADSETDIATRSEVNDIAALKDTVAMIVEALNHTRVLKSYSAQGGFTQQQSDELWRESDLIAADLEVALDRIDPEELNGWLESRW